MGVGVEALRGLDVERLKAAGTELNLIQGRYMTP